MKKWLCLLLVAVMMLPCFAMAEPAVVTVNNWSWVDSGWKDCLVEVYDLFAEKYGEEVTIDLDTFSASYADVMTNLLVQAPAGTTPDLAMVKAAWVPQLLELGVLADITTAVSAEVLADYTAGLGAYTVNGELVAIPYFGQGYAMFYNKDLFEKAGITELPKTFDEVLACAEKIAALGNDENGNRIYGLGLVNSETELAEGYNIFPWLWARGGDFSNENGEIVLNSEANLKAFTEIGSLYANNISPKGLGFKEMRNLFATGCLGMFWDLSSQTASFKQGSALGDEFINHIGAFPIPGATEGTAVGYNDDVVLVMFKSCKNVEAAGKVIEYMTGADTIGLMDKHGKGKMSSRSSVMAEVFKDVSDEITLAYVEAAKTNRGLPCMNSAFSAADEAITRSVTRLAQGEDAAQVLEALDLEVKDLYAGE